MEENIKVVNHLIENKTCQSLFSRTDSFPIPAIGNYLHTRFVCSDFYQKPSQTYLCKLLLNKIDFVLKFSEKLSVFCI